MVCIKFRLCCLVYLMVFSSSLVKCAPEEFPTSRRLFPSKLRDSQFDSSNGGFSFSIFRPPFWKRDSEEEESEERQVSVDEEKEIWAAVMDRAGDEVSTESVEVTTHDVTTVTPLKDVKTETPLMTEETSSEASSETATDPEVSSEDSQSEVTSTETTGGSSEGSQSESTSETVIETRGSSEDSESESTSTETKLDVETDLKPEASESSESSVSELSDLSVDAHDEKATSTQLEEEPSVTKTEETTVSTSQAEELVDTKELETKTSSKRFQEESVMKKTVPQTVEVMTTSEPTSQQPTVAAAVASPPAKNKDSHHIGHNLKVVSWTLAGVCVSVVIIGNFLGIYFSYIKPRLQQSALL